ncbi:hypothetical protein AMK06_CH02868 [Rhizobium sp. N541]|uniref:hypothetical protein n=1 Tax=unclassified Rhizobium TaxID=2613769 RepID=UPI0007EE32D9|nr:MULTISPECIES: hypothetical protein [unclassified Rhizobium]ANM17753.1 hypothetical protein AMK06_CH02868 [Rhizobium sp. N541]ANM24139.1 hypothetical protein AMK07_CH02866 [Rhizobium sp. N941]
MQQTITLNVGPHLSDDQWKTIGEVYRSMDGWVEGTQMPCWYGEEEYADYITASAEPSGLILEGNVEPGLWTGWISVICARLTMALGFPVHDATM